MVSGSLAIGGPCSTCRAKTTSATRSTSRGHRRDGPRRSSSRILIAMDTVGAHEEVGGSLGSTRVRAVDLLDLRGLVHGEYLRVDQRRVPPILLSRQNGGCVTRESGALPSDFKSAAPCALRLVMPPSGRTAPAARYGCQECHAWAGRSP